MNKRISIILPNRTLAVLRDRLKSEALANAKRDVAMAAEWFPLEEEAANRRFKIRKAK